jgi:hypothetical protein
MGWVGGRDAACGVGSVYSIAEEEGGWIGVGVCGRRGVYGCMSVWVLNRDKPCGCVGVWEGGVYGRVWAYGSVWVCVGVWACRGVWVYGRMGVH